jgi:hypothetical protein
MHLSNTVWGIIKRAYPLFSVKQSLSAAKPKSAIALLPHI